MTGYRAYEPDGKVAQDGKAKSDSVILQNPIAKHSVVNIGSTDCQVFIVERK